MEVLCVFKDAGMVTGVKKGNSLVGMSFTLQMLSDVEFVAKSFPTAGEEVAWLSL